MLHFAETAALLVGTAITVFSWLAFLVGANILVARAAAPFRRKRT